MRGDTCDGGGLKVVHKVLGDYILVWKRLDSASVETTRILWIDKCRTVFRFLSCRTAGHTARLMAGLMIVLCP